MPIGRVVAHAALVLSVAVGAAACSGDDSSVSSTSANPSYGTADGSASVADLTALFTSTKSYLAQKPLDGLETALNEAVSEMVWPVPAGGSAQADLTQGAASASAGNDGPVFSYLIADVDGSPALGLSVPVPSGGCAFLVGNSTTVLDAWSDQGVDGKSCTGRTALTSYLTPQP